MRLLAASTGGLSPLSPSPSTKEMQMSKQVIGVIVLLVLIIGAVIFAVTRTSAKKDIPEPLKQKTVDIYDVEESKIVKVNQMDFEQKFKGAPQDYSPLGTMVNPANGHHVVPLISCWKCHKQIPPALVKKGENGMDVMKAYVCPECKQPAYDPMILQGI
jgi:hypothetical protein